MPGIELPSALALSVRIEYQVVQAFEETRFALVSDRQSSVLGPMAGH